MENCCRGHIIRNTLFIKDNTTPPQLSRILDILLQKGHLLMDDRDEISLGRTSEQKCQLFLNFIQKRRGRAFEDLLLAFEDTGNGHVADKLRHTCTRQTSFCFAQQLNPKQPQVVFPAKRVGEKVDNTTITSKGVAKEDEMAMKEVGDIKEVDDIKEKCISLEQELNEKKIELEKLETQNFYFENQVGNLEEQVEKLKAEIKLKEDKILELKHKLGKFYAGQHLTRQDGKETREMLNKRLDHVDERLDSVFDELKKVLNAVNKQGQRNKQNTSKPKRKPTTDTNCKIEQ